MTSSSCSAAPSLRQRRSARLRVGRTATVGLVAAAVVVGQATAAGATPYTAPTAEVAVSASLQPVLHGASTDPGTGHSIHFYARTVGSSSWDLLNNVAVTGTDAYRQLPAGRLSIGQAFEYQVADCDGSGCTDSAIDTGYVSPALGAGTRSGATRVPFTIGDKIAAQVDVGSGNLLLTTTQFTLPRRDGSSLAVGAAYNSVTRLDQADFHGSLSPGWRLSTGVDVRVVPAGDGSVVYYGPNGLTGTFTPTGTSGQYTAPAGFKMDLSTEPSTGGWKLDDHGSGQTRHFSSGGLLMSIVDRNGNTATFTYTGDVLTAITSDVGGTGAKTLTVQTAGGGSSQVTGLSQTADGYGGATRSVSYGYDPTTGFLTSLTDTLGHTTSFGYGSSNNLNTITAPGGAVTSFTYDGQGRVLSVSQPTADPGTDAVTRFQYDSTQTLLADPNSDQFSSVSAAEHTTYTLTTDGRLLVASATDPAGNTRSATYTPFLDAASSSDPAGTTTFGHDTAVNGGESLTSIASPTGAGSSFAYANSAPAQFQPSSSTDGQKNTSTFSYDGAGNGLSVTDAGSNAASVTRNSDGTVATSTTPSGAVTSYGYDSTGQLTSITPPSGTSLGGRSFTYDDYGRLATVTDGRNTTTTYHYDSGDRITEIDYSDGTPGVTYSYNDAGQVHTRVDASGTTTYGYDPLGRLTSRSNTANSGGVSYSYDKAGNLATATNAAGTTSYSYDSRELVTSMTDPAGRVITFANDASGRRTDTWFNATTDGYGTITGFAAHTHTVYDASGRITEVWTSRNSSDATKVSDLAYSYAFDSDGGSCTSALAAGADSGLRWVAHDKISGVYTNYCYDTSNRLITADPGNAGPTGYTYDPDGNRTKVTAPGGSVTQSLTVNATDQLTTAGYGYDADGNTTSDPAHGTAGYNAANQMTTQGPGSYSYAGTDQTELVSDPNGRTYTYGRTSPTTGLPLIESFTDGGASYSYLYDPQGTPLAIEASSTHYLALDGLGSVLAAINNTGSVTATYAYDPWGNTTATAQNGSGIVHIQLYGYTGGITDPASDLLHLGHRWYDPTTGRFTQMDSIVTLADPTRANRYEYAGDNPIDLVDPSGRTTTCFTSYTYICTTTDSNLSQAASSVFNENSLAVGCDYGALVSLIPPVGEVAWPIAAGCAYFIIRDIATRATS